MTNENLPASQTDDIHLDPELAQLFEQAHEPVLGDDFSQQVIKNARNKRHHNWFIAALIMALLFVISEPLQNLGIAVSELLLVELVNMENQFAALVLAPLNSIAGVVSVVVLGMRLFYRQFFT